MISKASFLALLIAGLQAAGAEPGGRAAEPGDRAAEPAAKRGLLADIVIKGEENDGFSAGKPALNLTIDPYETLRASLAPDEGQLLAESPVFAAWIRSRPDRLKNEHLLQPWNDALTELSELPLPVRQLLASALGRPPSAKELKDASWSLSLVDEEGKPIHKFEGAGLPPEQVVWNGRSTQGDWINAGHAYSAVYKFSESSTTTRTILGPAVQFSGLVRRNGEGHIISLDSAVLFGANRQDADVLPSGRGLLRAAADWIRRGAYGQPVLLRAYGTDTAKGQRQAASAKDYLVSELGLPPETISTEVAAASATEQRVDLVIGGR